MKTLPPGYKRGSHGFIFRWNGFEYVRAEFDPEYTYRAATISGNVKTGRKRETIIDGKKMCKGKHGCGQMKPLHEFGMNKGYHMSACKKCEIKRTSKMKKVERKAA